MAASSRPLASALALVALLGVSTLPAGPAAAQQARIGSLFGGPFDLVDRAGNRVDEETFRGRHVLIYFGYTSCPDVCPTDLASMAAALDALGGLVDRVQAIFVSVDPARDSPADAAGYAAAFHPAILGLAGSEAEVAAAARAWRVHRRKVLLEGAAPGDYLVDHSSITYLMGPDGEFLTLFPHGTPPERMAAALRTYLR